MVAVHVVVGPGAEISEDAEEILYRFNLSVPETLADTILEMVVCVCVRKMAGTLQTAEGEAHQENN